MKLRGNQISSLGRLAQQLPIAVPAAIAAFGVVAVGLLLSGNLRDFLVWPLGLAAALVVVVVVLRSPSVERPGSQRERLICDVLVVLGVLAWGVWNAVYASEHVFTNRDPATYANAGAWLIDHPDLTIDTPAVFGDVAGIKTESPGLASPPGEPEVVHAQGQHLLPVLLGLGGRIVGEDLMFRLAPLFGMSALLAVYGFARLVARPRWAVVAVGALAISLPMLYFSRDTYTEPLLMTFVFGALSLLWTAHKTDSTKLWLLAGLVAGAGALVRIDIYVTLAGFVAFLAIALAVAKKKERSRRLKQAAVFASAASLPALIGLADIMLLSKPYFLQHQSLLIQELLALAAAIVAGLVLVAVCWRTRWLPRIDRATRAWRGPALAIAVLLVALALASRPLWYTSYVASQNNYIAAIQLSEGLAVEPRNYAESTVNWIAWYIGPILAALGVIGLALTAARSVKKGGLLLSLGLLVVMATALVYLIKPSVAPDQIWASRRLLPVVLPGLIIFGVLALQKVEQSLFTHRRFRQLFVVLAAMAIIIGPLSVSRPFLKVRDTVQAPLFKGFCQALPDKAAVLWLGDGQYYNLQATRSLCGVPAYAYTGAPLQRADLAKAAANARQAGYRPIIAVFGGERSLLGDDQQFVRQVSAHTYQEMELRIAGPPRKLDTKSYAFFIGELKADGKVGRIDNGQ